jgi:protocatechuate 3,4-dioxygenase beta subunit
MAFGRRAFLVFCGAALAGSPRLRAQDLGQFGVSAPPCTDDPRITPSVPRDSSYKPGAPLRTSLVDRTMRGTALALSGTVTGLSCGRIKGAEVEVWQPDAAGHFDATGFRLRARQLSDAEGRFRLTTILPGASAGRAPHLGVHINVTGKRELWTELFLPNDPRNASDSRFRPELVLKMQRVGSGQAATFDFVLDL